jgi:hypothetical protein
MANNGNNEDVAIELKKKFVNSRNIETTFANDMVINHTEREFFLAFYQTEPPFIINADDIKGLDSVDAVLVAKIIVTPEFAEAIAKAIQTNTDSYKKSKNGKA